MRCACARLPQPLETPPRTVAACAIELAWRTSGESRLSPKGGCPGNWTPAFRRQIQQVSKIQEIANPFVSTDSELSDHRLASPLTTAAMILVKMLYVEDVLGDHVMGGGGE